MKRSGLSAVLGVSIALALMAQSGEMLSELTILDGVRFAVAAPFRIAASDSDEEQIVFARQGGQLVTGSLIYAEAVEDIKAELFMYIRGNFFEEIADESKEVFTVEMARAFRGVPAYWLKFNLDGREYLFFAADLRQVPGGRVKLVVFSAEGDPREQASELRALVDKLSIEIQDAAG
jgi:hypothetical protein